MCGINGIYGLENLSSSEEIVRKMNDSLAHRGPDAEGVFSNDTLVLGHRRLSIIDTSPQGNQPFHSKDKNISLVFNGEIYNYLELKETLKDYGFRTHCDTEVLIAAYEKWGIDCVHQLNGMFAFALWDNQKKKLFLVRDRLGIKPLYYAHKGNHFIFSSEVRPILETGLVSKKMDHSNLIDYLRYTTVHAPNTLLEDVFMVMPGHIIEISDNEYEVRSWWNPAERASKEPERLNLTQVQSGIRDRLRDAVEIRMRSDVPYGAFLSGGIDSSIIVGLMAEVSEHPVQTFSVTFNEEEFNEGIYSKMVADKFKTEYNEILLSPNDFLNLIPDALNAMDHPSGDGPNTFVVSKMTKAKGITMALSGLGGDELFAGYDIFPRSVKLKDRKWITSFPKATRTIAGNMLRKMRPSIASEKIHSLLSGDYMDFEFTYPLSRQVLLDQTISRLTGINRLPKNRVYEIVSEALEYGTAGSHLPFLSKVSIAEMSTYMQNVLLRDTDQMTMAHALEVRVPFLDHHLAEFALGINDQMKFPHTPKELLVSSFENLLPSAVVNRPKMGFSLPYKHWLKNELKPMAVEHLTALENTPYFKDGALTEMYKRFEKGDSLVTWSRIWPLIVLSHWMNKHGVS